LISGRYRIPSGLISTSWGSVSANRISAASLGNGAAERPWNDRVQSIFSSGAVSSRRGLSARPLWEMFSVVGRFGVGADTRVVELVGAGEEGFWVGVVVDGLEEGTVGFSFCFWELL
jgi:hypothetical protein